MPGLSVEGDYLKFLLNGEWKQVRKDKLVRVDWAGSSGIGIEALSPSKIYAPENEYLAELSAEEKEKVLGHVNTNDAERNGMVRASNGDLFVCDKPNENGINYVLDTGRGMLFFDSDGKLYMNELFWDYMKDTREDIVKSFAVYAKCKNKHSSAWIIVYEQISKKKLALWSTYRGYIEF